MFMWVFESLADWLSAHIPNDQGMFGDSNETGIVSRILGLLTTCCIIQFLENFVFNYCQSLSFIRLNAILFSSLFSIFLNAHYTFFASFSVSFCCSLKHAGLGLICTEDGMNQFPLLMTLY